MATKSGVVEAVSLQLASMDSEHAVDFWEPISSAVTPGHLPTTTQKVIKIK